MKLRFMPRQPKSLAVVRQFIVAVPASLPFAMAGSAIAWPSPTLPKILADEAPISLNIPQISWMVSLFYLGSLSSPILAVYLADRFGRRKTLLYSGLLPIISWLLILIGSHPSILYAARYLAGLHFGLVSTVQPIYIEELLQSDIRDYLSSLNIFMMGVGSFLMFVVGKYVCYYTLALVSLSLPLLFILIFPYMPESPFYSVMKGEADEARETLFWLRGDLNRIELELELNHIDKNVQNYKENTGSFKDILATKASRKAMAISGVFSALKALSGSGVIPVYATLTLPTSTFGIFDPNTCMIMIGTVSIISSLVVVFIEEKFDRTFLLSVSCTGCALSMLAVTVWLFLDEKTNILMNSTNFVVFIGYLVQDVFYNLASGPFEATSKSEFFSLLVKNKSSALASMTLAIASFILNKFYLFIADWEGMYLNYLIFTISSFLSIFFIKFYVPETRGKTIHEIQDILNGVERFRIPPVLSRTF